MQPDPGHADWSVATGGITLDQLHLLELRHVSLGSWQPVLCLTPATAPA